MADQSEWIFLGSGSDCEVRVVGQNVASRHARCRLESNGRVRIEDLGSPGGTAINNPGLRISINYLNPSDTVYLAVHPASATQVYEVLRRKKPGPPVLAPPPPPPLLPSRPPPPPPSPSPSLSPWGGRGTPGPPRPPRKGCGPSEVSQ